MLPPLQALVIDLTGQVRAHQFRGEFYGLRLHSAGIHCRAARARAEGQAKSLLETRTTDDGKSFRSGLLFLQVEVYACTSG